MHTTIVNLKKIINEINERLQKNNAKKNLNIIAVSKTFGMDKIEPLINYGHIHFGENKVQEAVEKWTDLKKTNGNIKLHMIGKLQSNKVKQVVPLFDYLHSLDNYKLAKKIHEEENKNNKKIKIFNFALSDRSTKKILNINRLSSTSSIEKVNENSWYSKIKKIITFSEKYVEKKVEIKTKTLNSVLPSKNLSKYFLKIDVEGHEIYVLKGLNKKIKKIPYIMVEHQIFNLYKKNESVQKFLEKNHFYILKKFTFPSFHTQDIIYKNSKL